MSSDEANETKCKQLVSLGKVVQGSLGLYLQHFHMDEILFKDTSKYWIKPQKMGRKETLTHCCWKCKPMWFIASYNHESVWSFLKQ